jgi:hypothetical protein
LGKHAGGDYGCSHLVLLVIGLLVVGARRLQHLRYLANDSLFARFCYTQVYNIDPAASSLDSFCGSLNFCANLGPSYGAETFNSEGLSFLLELNGFTTGKGSVAWTWPRRQSLARL